MARHGTKRIQPKTGIEYIVGEWCPDLVGRVAGYPKTAEAYEQFRARLNHQRERAKVAGRLVRTGVSNGWGGRKNEVLALRQNAFTDAERIIEKLVDRGAWVPDCWEAEFAMTAAVAIILDPTVHHKIRLEAARTVLTFTTPKPTSGRISRHLAEELMLQMGVLKEENSTAGPLCCPYKATYGSPQKGQLNQGDERTTM